MLPPGGRGPHRCLVRSRKLDESRFDPAAQTLTRSCRIRFETASQTPSCGGPAPTTDRSKTPATGLRTRRVDQTPVTEASVVSQTTPKIERPGNAGRKHPELGHE